MTDLRLSARELEDVLAGRQPDGRADLAPLAEVAALLHASREVEPAPPISDSLRAQIDGGAQRQATPTAVRRRRHRPRHMQAVTPSGSRAASYRRPLVSLAAAAVLLVGLVLATSQGNLPGDVHSAVSDMGSAIGLDLFRSDDAAPAEEPPPTTTSSTTTTTAPPTTVPPSSTTAPPTTQAPTGQPSDPDDLPWWLRPEVWQQFGFGQWSSGGHWGGDGRSGNYDRDRDHDGDGDGTGAGSGSGTGGDGMARPDGDTGTTGTTMPSTTMAPTSTSTSPPSSTTGSTATTQ